MVSVLSYWFSILNSLNIKKESKGIRIFSKLINPFLTHVTGSKMTKNVKYDKI